MKIERSAGTLLHITSLPGRYGIGTLGKEARDFAELLVRAGQSYWQVLPLGPVVPAFDYSPYASTSTFAGNPYFISLEEVAKKPWHGGPIDEENFLEDHFIDFDRVTLHKERELSRANELFFSSAKDEDLEAFEKFCQDERSWLGDYALFSALAEHYDTNNWLEWDSGAAMRDAAALEKWNMRLKDRASYHRFVQFLFFEQWNALRKHCNTLGIRLIGDIPIYINLEGADAWTNPDILQLDEKTKRPSAVAGVPPDYFSETGQRWGNPLYRWADRDGALLEKTYEWWKKRLRRLLSLVDVVRIDHFRAFESYWSIPAKEKTAVKGKWIKGPGTAFFERLRKDLGDIPIIAEDLGVITDEVRELRDGLRIPGMKVLQFAFDENSDNEYLPHNMEKSNCVVYTGTHDNNTINGWFYGIENDDERRKYILEYIGSEKFSDFHWQLIRTAYMTTARLAIVPAQDILGYGQEFRMNIPGTTGGNWRWKLRENEITPEMADKLKRLAAMYRR